jgi:hypothetical protein
VPLLTLRKVDSFSSWAIASVSVFSMSAAGMLFMWVVVGSDDNRCISDVNRTCRAVMIQFANIQAD